VIDGVFVGLKELSSESKNLSECRVFIFEIGFLRTGLSVIKIFERATKVSCTGFTIQQTA
jgi:hypothetical protein